MQNPIAEFLSLTQNGVRAYESLGQGKLLITCIKSPNDGGAKEYLVNLCGSLRQPFRFSASQLESYLLQRRQPTPSKQGAIDPFSHLEQRFLEILQRSGHGEITLDFEQGRRGYTVILCRTTISDRLVIPSMFEVTG